MAGQSVVSVDGAGTVRRCHFVPAPLGNLYDCSHRAALRPRACPPASCDCHFGYVHPDIPAGPPPLSDGGEDLVGQRLVEGRVNQAVGQAGHLATADETAQLLG
jgi:hypothetical protein